MKIIKKQLKTYCELYWWNMGRKTCSFKGELKDLLKDECITFTKRKTKDTGIYTFYFKNSHGISFKSKNPITDFSYLAKIMLQIGLVRMGDKAELYVRGTWRPTVSVNK